MKKNIRSLLSKSFLVLPALLAASLAFSGTGTTQDLNKTIIPIELKNASLKQAFHQVESQTRLLFSFKTEDVDAYNNINYSSKGVAVARLLRDLLKGTDLQYEQMNNNIIIKKYMMNGPGPEISGPADDLVALAGGVHGKVTNEKGEPIPGASIAIANGEFSLPGLAAGSYRIQVSAVGYLSETQTVVVAGNDMAYLSISLKEAINNLNDVVVTALGIKRSVKSLGYAAQEVSGADLVASHQPNLINALQGKVAGVTISSAGGGPGQGASIIIRGVNSLNPDKSNQPLYVVDGIPIDNTTSTLGTDGGRGVQMANRAADINPDDIESINILRGGAATALYGLRGANGVIVITPRTTASMRATNFPRSRASIPRDSMVYTIPPVFGRTGARPLPPPKPLIQRIRISSLTSTSMPM
jgi:TonB-dependent SusC/RagA subfamily outer membrane receptor